MLKRLVGKVTGSPVLIERPKGIAEERNPFPEGLRIVVNIATA